MTEIPYTSAPNKGKKSIDGKRHAKLNTQNEDAKFFHSNMAYERYCATVLKIVTLLKC